MDLIEIDDKIRITSLVLKDVIRRLLIVQPWTSYVKNVSPVGDERILPYADYSS